MSENNLLKARVYECLIEEMDKTGNQEDRPVYHASPRVGWMNDPNGFSYYKGEYHLFYQYYPFKKEWGPMHWGHMKSSNLLHWDQLPAALAPDSDYDLEGCWSGSAVELRDGRHMLIYTGRTPLPAGTSQGEAGEIVQVQCLAFGDGLNYEKYEANPVITAQDLPDGASIYDFRDPKIWWDDQDQAYYLVVGNRAPDGRGQILLFRSLDGITWSHDSILASNNQRIGTMWECPDFFQIDDKAFLLVSPQEMAGQAQNQNIHGNVVISGTYDAASHRFDQGQARVIDRGYDFYASQSMEAPDGRRIMIAWMQAWENSRERKEDDRSWFGMMTVPRELSQKEGRLIQWPVRELETMRTRPVIVKDLTMEGSIALPEVKGRVLDLTVTIEPETAGSYDRFEIHLAQGQGYSTLLAYEPSTGRVIYDRSASGHGPDRLPPRSFVLDQPADRISFRILLDKYSSEIFINGGEEVISSTMLTPLEADGISFFSQGKTLVSLEKYDLF